MKQSASSWAISMRAGPQWKPNRGKIPLSYCGEFSEVGERQVCELIRSVRRQAGKENPTTDPGIQVFSVVILLTGKFSNGTVRNQKHMPCKEVS